MLSEDREVTVLIVDDDPGIRFSFADYLSDRDYRVVMAENGLAGLESFRQERPDIVLLDLRMPEMGGLELMREIKYLDDQVPVVVVSGTGRIADAVEALHLGAWDYLLKPVEDLSILAHMVEQSLERARLRQENREYQENLERLVKQRTADLEDANGQLQHLNNRLRKIVSTTGRLSSWLDMQEFGARLLQEFAQHMNASGGSFYLVDNSSLHLLHTLDPGHAPEELQFPLADDSILRRVIERREPVLVNGSGETREFTGSGWKGYQDDSALIFPIPDEHGQVAAVLTLHNKSHPPFVEQDKEIGEILASYSCESLRAIRSFEALRESEQRFRELAEMLPQSICETDMEGRITYANQQAFRLYGYSRQDVERGLNIFDVVASNDAERIRRNAMKVLHRRSMRSEGTEYLAVRKDGSRFPVLAYSSPIVRNGKTVGMRLAVVDITLRKRQEELILHQAHFDSLTDLPNRFLCLDRLSQVLKDAQRSATLVAILFIDLDDFKRINDTLGHEVGDQVLIQTAARLREAMRAVDTVGRLGGDEFIVILGGVTDGMDVQGIADDLLKRIRQPLVLDGRELVLTSSIGIAIYPQDGETPAELLRSADTAMYHAKGEGRNMSYFFAAGMNQDVSRKLLLEQHLHGALEREEMYVCYQPVVELPGRNIVGFEALLRWNSPQLGMVSPAEFIPVAEHSGLIIRIGGFVLGEALKVLQQLHARFGTHIGMAVNLSPRQFRDPSLPQQVQLALDEAGVARNCLDMEITEGVLMTGHAYIDQALSHLSELGVGIAMDDFGTGYSSLSYLRRYPFDRLKIDRSFIRDVSDDPRDRELVNAAIAMAHGLGMKVVAEGVETEAQAEYLVQQGCDRAQGYFFGRPVPAGELESMLG